MGLEVKKKKGGGGVILEGRLKTSLQKIGAYLLAVEGHV